MLVRFALSGKDAFGALLGVVLLKRFSREGVVTP